MKGLSIWARRRTIALGQMTLFALLALGTREAPGQGNVPATKGNLDLALQGPFVVCEADDTSLFIFAPNPKGATEHQDAGLLTDFVDFRMQEGTTDYELKGDLHAGSMQIINPENMSRSEFAKGCPTTGYFWRLKVPKPDEIYYTWPESLVIEHNDRCEGAPTRPAQSYATRFVLRYRGVDVAQGFQVSDGKNATDLKVLKIGREVSMVFQMPPIGEHPDHDKDTYAEMAKMAGVKSCIYIPTEQPSHLWPPGQILRNGHTDCHAPLIYLAATKKPTN